MGSGKSKTKKRGGFFRDTPASTTQIARYTPEQEGLQNQALSQSLRGLGGLSLPGDKLTSSFDFAPIAQNAQANFQQNTIPSLAERFTSLGYGTGNALSSPVFAQQAGQAGAGLEGELARLAAEYGLQKQGLEQGERAQQANNLFNILNTGLGERFDTLYQPAQKSGFKRLLGGLGSAAVQAGAAYLGGPAGLAAAQGLTGALGGQNNNQQPSMISGNSSPYAGWQGNATGFGINPSGRLGQRSAGVSALNNQNQQFANPNAMPGYRDVINLLANSYGR